MEIQGRKELLLMPISGSELVSFDSDPEPYYRYMTEKYGGEWKYTGTTNYLGERCLIWEIVESRVFR